VLRRTCGGLVVLVGSGALACTPPAGPRSASDLQPASLGVPATAALVVGCWSLGWQIEPASAARSAGELPDSVRLRNEVVFATRERLVVPATHPTGRVGAGDDARPWEARFVLNRWWIEEDALRLRFSDGVQDTWQVGLAVDADELVGRARYEGEASAGETPKAADVRAARIDCEYE
jgi:hypothetical protein